MNCISRFSIVGIAALCTVAGSLAFAQAGKETKPAAPKAPAHAAPPAKTPAAPGAGDMQLPPGMTAEDMKACMEAATPGPQHEELAKSVGVWSGKSKTWMAPNTEPQASECKSVVTSIMDGRFIKVEITGEMPGMPGPFNGMGVYGFDNVSKAYQTTWIDNCGTGMMTGSGEATSDGKTITWTYTGNCPMTKKPMTMREVDTWTGKDTKTMVMYAPDPATGNEFKMMETVFTRVSGAPAGAAAAAKTE